MAKRRVVVTGLGVQTPIGLDVKSSWSNLIEGKSGVALIEAFDVTDYPAKISGSVKNFDASAVMSGKDIKKLDTFIQYAAVAAAEAMADSGLEITEAMEPRVGVAVGSGIGGLPLLTEGYRIIAELGPRRLTPFIIPGSIINMLSGYLSIQYRARGPNISIVSACTTGTHNIGHGARMIAYGDADVMIAGGSEMSTCPLGLGGFASMRALSTRNDEPEKASRPWDKDRDGFVLGDGAGIMILEEYEHAKKRGANIYAELVGFGMSGDAYHITKPDSQGQGFTDCMTNALNDAALNVTDIAYINAHGTSTPTLDPIEAMSIRKTFGAHADNLGVSSNKSMIGHLLGAAGAVEAVFTVLTLRDQVAPPTINLDNPAEGCDLDFIPHVARNMKVDAALSNSFGFGGTNASLIFKRI